MRRARAVGEPVLAGMTVRLDAATDPSAVVWHSRRAGERWFCFEQPDRDGSALAALGSVAEIEERGPGRFARAAAAWRALLADAVADAPDGPRGAGLVAVGGFAFAPTRRRAPHWAGFAPATLTVPEVALARRGARGAAHGGGAGRGRRPARRAPRAPRRAPERAARGAAPAAGSRPRGSLAGGRARAARALRLGGGACGRAHPRRRPREDRAGARGRGPRGRRPRRRRRARRPARGVPELLRLLRGRRRRAPSSAPRPSCSCAARACAPSTVALAGSTRRSADPAVDDHLGEQLLRSDKDREEQAIVDAPHRAGAAPGSGLGGRRAGADGRARRQHPAPRDADPRAARAAAERGRARGRAAPDAGRRRRAARGRPSR